jgi:hypothetical protein
MVVVKQKKEERVRMVVSKRIDDKWTESSE